MDKEASIEKREAPLAMRPEAFRALGYQLVDRIAGFLDSLPERRVTPGESPLDVRQVLESERPLPQRGADPALVLNHAADLLFEHSLFNGHPRLGIHHLISGSNRCVRRPTRRRCKSERRRLVTLANGE